jgi:hypothetical protein
MDAPCYVLMFNPRRDAWLIAFNDPERNLVLDKPCYLAPQAIDAFAAFDEGTGEIYPGRVEIGPGLIRLSPSIWNALPNLIATYLIEEERTRLRLAKEAHDAENRHPANVRQKEDRMLRARRAKKRRQAEKGQTDIFGDSDL